MTRIWFLHVDHFARKMPVYFENVCCQAWQNWQRKRVYLRMSWHSKSREDEHMHIKLDRISTAVVQLQFLNQRRKLLSLNCSFSNSSPTSLTVPKTTTTVMTQGDTRGGSTRTSLSCWVICRPKSLTTEASHTAYSRSLDSICQSKRQEKAIKTDVKSIQETCDLWADQRWRPHSDVKVIDLQCLPNYNSLWWRQALI